MKKIIYLLPVLAFALNSSANSVPPSTPTPPSTSESGRSIDWPTFQEDFDKIKTDVKDLKKEPKKPTLDDVSKTIDDVNTKLQALKTQTDALDTKIKALPQDGKDPKVKKFTSEFEREKKSQAHVKALPFTLQLAALHDGVKKFKEKIQDLEKATKAKETDKITAAETDLIHLNTSLTATIKNTNTVLSALEADDSTKAFGPIKHGEKNLESIRTTWSAEANKAISIDANLKDKLPVDPNLLQHSAPTAK